MINKSQFLQTVHVLNWEWIPPVCIVNQLSVVAGKKWYNWCRTSHTSSLFGLKITCWPNKWLARTGKSLKITQRRDCLRILSCPDILPCGTSLCETQNPKWCKYLLVYQKWIIYCIIESKHLSAFHNKNFSVNKCILLLQLHWMFRL